MKCVKLLAVYKITLNTNNPLNSASNIKYKIEPEKLHFCLKKEEKQTVIYVTCRACWWIEEEKKHLAEMKIRLAFLPREQELYLNWNTDIAKEIF